MDDLGEKISLRIQSLKAKFEGGSSQQDSLRKQSKNIFRVVLFATLLFIATLIQTVVFAITANLCSIASRHPLLTADLSDLLSPLAIIVSILMAAYLALNQLIEKVNRDRVEHAHDLCSSAPDINIVFASIGPLNNHLGDAYRNCLEASKLPSKESPNENPWEAFVIRMEHMAEHFPSAIKSITRTLQADHKEDVEKIYEALAFFEKTSIAICNKHADDQVFWSRYNVAGFGIWIYSFPIIINEWFRYKNNGYLYEAKSIGMPFEHFESWLRYHSAQDIDSGLDPLMDRLSHIRSKILEES